MDRELIKLIEENGLTLHGDIEFFAHLVAEREREACARVCDWWNVSHCAAAIRARGDA
jgi:hypothetical protein